MSKITARLGIAGLAACLLLATASACGSGGSPAQTPGASATGSVPVVTLPPPTSTNSPATAPGATSPAPAPAPALRGLPLFPFGSPADARAWEQAYRSGGHQPWHLNAGDTAKAFTAYLGFSELNLVTSSSVKSADAYVGVGALNPNKQPFTAAIVHLVKYGTDRYAPWEVVGTQDTTLTLTTPAYASHVASPVTLGGRITGVDESLSLYVFQLTSQSPLGSTHGIPAGGQNAPWSGKVVFSGATGHVLTLVVSTGGHFAAVERFAVTAAATG
jgi:hypothetical protein